MTVQVELFSTSLNTLRFKTVLITELLCSMRIGKKYDLRGQRQNKREQLADIIWDKHDLSFHSLH